MSAPKPVGDAKLPIELQGVAETIAEGNGLWRTCTGCHEPNEGYNTGPHSALLGCTLGMGCSECGGIGAIWDTTDYADMVEQVAAADARDAAAAKQRADTLKIESALSMLIDTIKPGLDTGDIAEDGATALRALAARNAAVERLIEAAEKVIAMNRQEAEDRCGDAEKAEHWSCVTVLREGLAAVRGGAPAPSEKPSAESGTCPHGYPQTVRCSRCGE